MSLTPSSSALSSESHRFRSTSQRAAFCDFAISNSSSHSLLFLATVLLPNWSTISKNSPGSNAQKNKILFPSLAFFYFPLQHLDYLFYFRSIAYFASEKDWPFGYVDKEDFRKSRSTSSLLSNKTTLILQEILNLNINLYFNRIIF